MTKRMTEQPLPDAPDIAGLDVCANCIYWIEAQVSEAGGVVTIGQPKAGVCTGVPPTPFPVQDQRGQMAGQRNFRPMTRENERACALFDPGEIEEDDNSVQ